jgi:hypothetical protein
MVGIVLAIMIGRIICGFSGLQILFEYHSFTGVSESLYLLE